MQLNAKSTLDKLLLIGAAVLLIAAMVGSRLAVNTYRLSPLLLPGFWLGLLAGVVAFRAARPKFRRPVFVLFFLAWLALEDAVSVWAARRGGLVWTVGAMLAGLFIFFFLTVLLFGPIDAKPRKPAGSNDPAPKGGWRRH
jgi:hypothetical protein